MISRMITRVPVAALRLALPALARPLFLFSKVEKVTNYKQIIEKEIKAEEENLTDLATYESNFQAEGWTISKENTLVELHKKVGKYDVRLLSNVKAPSNFGDEQEGEKQPEKEQGEEDFNGDMNEVSILVTKAGSEKTMVINTIVTEGFEITNIAFSDSYAKAKANRFDIFSSNQYTGPEIETLSDELFESIYGFLEEELAIKNETLESFADYCLDSEQTFYIGWLKDLKNIL